MLFASITELVSQSPMGWLNAMASYRTAREEWTWGVRIRVSRGTKDETTCNNERGGTRTENIAFMPVTELVFQAPMGWLNVTADYRTAREEWTWGVSGRSRDGDEETTQQKSSVDEYVP